MKSFFTENKHNPFFWGFIFLAIILFFLMPIMSRDAGNSGDEDGFQIPQGYNVLNYYKTNHQDTTCMTFQNLKYYGCSFDVVMAWVNETFHIEDISTSRHMANAFLGWLTVLFVGLIAWRIGGWRAGVLAMLLMFLSPRFLGHSFNNPKDIPLATGVIMSIYYIMMFFRQASNPDRRYPKIITMVMLVLSLALAISTRIGGLIIIGYFGLWGLLWAISRRNGAYTSNSIDAPNIKSGSKNTSSKRPKHSYDWSGLFRAFIYAVAICIIGFFAGLLLWPYAMEAPIKNSIESYHAMSKFAIALRQVYEGQMVWSDVLPWYYTPKFILTTIPIAVIIGWILYPCLGAFKKSGTEENPLRRIENAMLYFCFIFPVAWIVYTKANVYGGWRHSLFAYPPMVASAALGFNALIEKFKEPKTSSDTDNDTTKSKLPISKIWEVLCYVVLAILLIGPVKHICKNHPYEYVYFNGLAGGTKNAFTNYEMDYYYHSMREATEWVIEHAEPSPLQTGKKIVVGSWHVNSTQYFLRNDTARFQLKFIRWYQRGDNDWDYAVFPITGIAPEYLSNSKVFPPKNMVHSIDVDGVPIAVVLKRDNKDDYYGARYKAAKQIDSAMFFFRRALEHNPYNESVLLDMAEIYLMTNKPDSTLYMCNRFFEFEPSNDNANYFAAYAYVMKGDATKALEICQNIKKHNFKYVSAYQLSIQIYLQQQNLNAAENEILQLIDADQLDNQAVSSYIAIQRARGLDEKMAYRGLYNSMVKSYEKRGKKEEAEIYRNYLRSI